MHTHPMDNIRQDTRVHPIQIDGLNGRVIEKLNCEHILHFKKLIKTILTRNSSQNQATVTLIRPAVNVNPTQSL